MSSVRQEYSATVRMMRHSDLVSIAAVERLSYDFPWSQGVFRDCLLAGYYCLVLEHQGEIRGYAILSVAAGEAHILNLCISPELRGYGYGARLLDELLARSRALQVQQVLLEVRPSNETAVLLYKKRGFVRIGARHNYYQAHQGREDAWVYSLVIRSHTP